MDNKEVAAAFLELIIKGNVDEAFERHVSSNGKHHNIHVEAGLGPLKDAPPRSF